uniref:Translation initiation factor IF-3, chloroplastic n=1 Tax=Lygus hesperus TaxID=30085 RepID=A0A0A9YHD1_LYGHE
MHIKESIPTRNEDAEGEEKRSERSRVQTTEPNMNVQQAILGQTVPNTVEVGQTCRDRILQSLDLSQRMLHYTLSLSKHRDETDTFIDQTNALRNRLSELT